MPRSRPSAKPCLTIRCFGRCLGPVLLSRPDCSPPSVNNVSVIRAPPRFSATPASLPSPRAVATSTGSTGDCNAPRSYGRPLSNGLAPPFQDRSGPLPIIDSNATKVAPTRRPCAPWPSNGFAFCIAVGRPEPLTMSPPISMRSNAAARRYSLRSWGLQKILDRQSQGVSLQDQRARRDTRVVLRPRGPQQRLSTAHGAGARRTSDAPSAVVLILVGEWEE